MLQSPPASRPLHVIPSKHPRQPGPRRQIELALAPAAGPPFRHHPDLAEVAPPAMMAAQQSAAAGAAPPPRRPAAGGPTCCCQQRQQAAAVHHRSSDDDDADFDEGVLFIMRTVNRNRWLRTGRRRRRRAQVLAGAAAAGSAA
ncbi:hypothetical protein CHLRE_16g685628v5 [Chlamydomonas reinhardtii]|uniref:Uncharacterized protein n=1 Tax=Chlamydomonas reinhardtii TaxID=3055 RepID=A0A2K3CUR2_CHLRE|nr:uncharacterized protein CHLRE_16g685628v5 [Chlamydomonas reinhardtii]PNW72023.1 hypothetical protein CHLRE_16g685628v5 [Chlamydomonas reinhardtii]